MGRSEKNRATLTSLIWLFTNACGSAHESRISADGVKALDVREGGLGQGGGGGNDGSGDGPGGPDSQVPGPGGDPVVEEKSIAAFQRTVFPLGVKWCGLGCHDVAQAPVFASRDIKSSHDILFVTHKVDLKNIARSRLVLRVSEDNHNCPSEGCEEATKGFTDAITAWSKEVDAVSKQEAPVGAMSGTRKFADAEASYVDPGMPPGTFLMEAEKGTLKAPMAAMPVAGAGGDMVVGTPAGAGSQNNITTAETQATLGGVTFNITVDTPGNYRLIGRVNGPANATSSFYIKVDQAPLLLWDFPATQANYVYDVADAAAAAGTPHLINLTAGNHTIEIRQRQEQSKLDTLIVTNDPEIDPMAIKPTPREMKTISFDVGALAKVEGAKILVDVGDYSKNGYLLKNLRMVTPSGKVRVKGIKLYVNGVYLPQHSTFTTVDTTITAPGGSLSKSSLVAIKDQGPEADQFSFSFDVLESAP